MAEAGSTEENKVHIRRSEGAKVSLVPKSQPTVATLLMFPPQVPLASPLTMGM